MRRATLTRLATMLASFLLFSLQVLAQTQVTGTVTDPTGKAVSGATVIVRGTNNATVTNENGEFTITAPANGTLVISAVGFGTSEIPIQNRTTIPVQLATREAALNEVVVIGYGTARRRDLTGAVSSVTPKDFNRGVIVAPDQLLQNKVPGLQITTNTGQPGGETTVRIRGNNSIRAGGNPLYVIDGVPLDGRSARPNFGNSFGSTPDANPLIFINPYDIARIDVLKDASSAAIYGSRGANGVIAITTKTGTTGAPRIEVNTSVGVNAGLMKRFEVLNAAQFRQALTKYNITGQDNGATVDPLKEVANKNLTQNYGISFSGGGENGRFRASLLASEVNGYFKNSELDKYIGTFSGQYNFLDRKLTLGFNAIAGHTSESLVPVANTSGSEGNVVSSLLQWNPTTAFRNNNGRFVYPANGSGNPLALLAAYSDKALVNSVLGNVSAAYKILPNLEYKFMYAINNSVGDRFTNVYGFLQGYASISGRGAAAIANAKLTSQTIDHTLQYRTDLSSNLSMDALVGYEYWTTQYQNRNFSASGFNTNLNEGNLTGIPYTSMLQNGVQQAPPSISVDPKTELQSVFSRVSFNYANKYLLTATLRADGSSKFGENNKYGYFPSLGARWVVSNEDFLRGSSTLSNVALRASWGVTGNQEFPPGASQEQFAFGNFNNASQINVANPNLKWEETKAYNIGAEFGFLRGRINATFEYYHKNTTNILFQTVAIQPAPASTAFVNLPANLINKGIEASVDVTIIDKKNVSLDLFAFYTHNTNKLTNFTQNGRDLRITTGQINGQGVSGTLAQVITNNQPVNAYFLKPFQGFDQNGNQIIGADPILAGDPNPANSFGISTTLNFYKWVLNINGGGESGYLIYNNTATSVTNISGISNGRNIDLTAFNSNEKPSSGVGASTRFLESGNYFKLRNATLTYRFGDIGKYLRNFSAFVTGNNLFVLTKFTGFDPEVNVNKSNNNYPSRSIEYIPYPTPRIILVGVNFTLQ